MAIVVAFRLQIHVLIAALPGEGEVLRHFLNQTQVEGGPLIAVAIDITIFTALRQHGRGNKPAIAQRRGAIAGEAPGIGPRAQRAVGADAFNLGAQPVAVQQGRFAGPVAQAIEALIVQASRA